DIWPTRRATSRGLRRGRGRLIPAFELLHFGIPAQQFRNWRQQRRLAKGGRRVVRPTQQIVRPCHERICIAEPMPELVANDRLLLLEDLDRLLRMRSEER